MATVKFTYQPLILVGTGVKPTIPSPVNLKPGDYGWKDTDMLIGQSAYNVTDDIMYVRKANSIGTWTVAGMDWSNIINVPIASKTTFGIMEVGDNLSVNAGLVSVTPGVFETLADKNIASGYAGLDSNGLLFTSQLPPLAISQTYVVASEAEQLALTVQMGDIAVRTDLNTSYIALNSTNAAITDWQQLLTPTDNYVSGATWDTSTGDLTINRNALSDIVVPMDGRYIVANAAITGATHTKITYDANGLVTAGEDATTTDIPDSTDKRYITDIQKTLLQVLDDFGFSIPAPGTLLFDGNFAATKEIQAWSDDGSGLPASLLDALPIASTTSTGIAQFSSSNFAVDANGLVTLVTGSGGGMVYPAAGIPISTGTAWGTSIVDNSTNWNTAYTHSQIITGNPHQISYADLLGTKPTYTTSEIAEGTNLYYTDARVAAKVTQSYVNGLGVNAATFGTQNNNAFIRNRGVISVTTSNPFDNTLTEIQVLTNGLYQIRYTGASAFLLSMNVGGSANTAQLMSHYDGKTFAFRVATDGTTWNNWAYIWNSRNSNLTSVDWKAKNLTLAGAITGATTGVFSGNLQMATGSVNQSAPTSGYQFDVNGNLLVQGNIIATGEIQAWSNIGTLPPTFWDSLPIASTTSTGVVQIGAGLSVDANGLVSVTTAGGGTAAIWGNITGTLSDQLDLQTALNGKEPAFTKNTAFNKNFGTATKEVWGYDAHPTTTADYGLPAYPTTLPASDVYAWAKAATKPTYTTSEIAEGTNLYYTDARVAAKVTQSYVNGLGVTSSFSNFLNYHDSRSVVTTPETINRGLRLDFKQNSTEGLSDGGTYFGELTYRKYGSGADWSGGKSHQLGFTDNDNIWHRAGTGTTWGTWYKLFHSGNSNLTSVDWKAKNLILAGSITGATSITTGTITPTNLATGYLPYMNGSLVNSPIYTDGVGVSIGNTDTTFGLGVQKSISIFGYGYAADHSVNDVGAIIYHPNEGGSDGSRWFLRFDLTQNASFPYLTNRTPNGAVVIKTGTAAGGGENEHFRIKGGDGVVDTILTNTNLLIGYTSDPTTGNKLAVNGNGYFAGNVTATGNLSITGTATFNNTLTIQNSDSDSLLIATASANFANPIFKVGDINGVGYGTMYEIDFANNVHNFTGNIIATGEVQAWTPSDIRLKRDIQNITGANQILSQFRPVTHYWNETMKQLNPNKDDRLSWGLIAQEVQAVRPEFVHEIYENYLSVDYVSFVPLLIAGEQEHEMKIKQLEQRVSYLENELQMLRN